MGCCEMGMRIDSVCAPASSPRTGVRSLFAGPFDQCGIARLRAAAIRNDIFVRLELEVSESPGGLPTAWGYAPLYLANEVATRRSTLHLRAASRFASKSGMSPFKRIELRPASVRA